MTSYYDILGLDHAATLEEIKSAFRKKALLYHPDKLAAATASTNASAESDASDANFSKIKEAYDVLSDPLRRSIYDENNKQSIVSTHMPSFINDILVQMYVMASRPKLISVEINVPFEEVYHRKIKRIEIKVKRWINHNYIFTHEVFNISLINMQNKYVFVGMGDDSIIPSFPRGNIEIRLTISDYSNHLQIDDMFSEKDLFLTIPMSLYTFYNESEFNLELCPSVNIKCSNERKLSYHMLNAGLPTGACSRSDIYIEIKLIIPLRLRTDKSNKLQHVLKKYFT